MEADSPPRSRLRRLALELPLVLIAALLIIYSALRIRADDGGLITISDHQAGVLVDFRTGRLTPDVSPGVKTFIPWLQRWYRLDRRPIEYVMAGNEHLDENRVPRLLVRGSDGTSYIFERVELQYALDTERLTTALRDSGPGSGYRRLVDAYARPILRDAFGRYTPQEIVLPDRKQKATEEAKRELSKALAVHGIQVLELSVSKPTFPKAYEDTIDRRRVAEQDLAKLRRERQQLLEIKPTRFAHLRRMKELERNREVAKLQRRLEKARLAAQRAREEADRYHTGRLLAGQLARDERVSQAAAQEVTFRKEAEGFRAHTDALAAGGASVVRAALVKQLSKIQFELVPYDRALPGARKTAFVGNDH